MQLLRELCETTGVPGYEDRLRAIVRRELEPLADEIAVDALGNVIAQKRGETSRRLVINAHLDEIGFLVNYIEEDGYLRLVPLGGHDPRNMVAQRVVVCGKEELVGLLYPGVKPPHLTTAEERKKVPTVPDFFVDLGLPGEQVRERVPIGSPVVIHREFAEVGDAVTCKAMDDRVSVYVMIEAMRAARSFGFDTYAVATVQEEVGLRGATTSSYALVPDVGIAVDVTIAADIPGVPKHEAVTRAGKGVAIKIMDSSSISNPKVVAALRSLAEAREIPHQMEILPRGGTDAGALQRARGGAPVGTISIPTRYIHTSIEMAYRRDIEAAIRLLAAFLEEGHRFDFALA